MQKTKEQMAEGEIDDPYVPQVILDAYSLIARRRYQAAVKLISDSPLGAEIQMMDINQGGLPQGMSCVRDWIGRRSDPVAAYGGLTPTQDAAWFSRRAGKFMVHRRAVDREGQSSPEDPCLYYCGHDALYLLRADNNAFWPREMR